VRAEIVRRGGLAGIPLSGVVDTAQLPADIAARTEAALRALPFGRPPSPPRHPEGFQYEITLTEDGQRRSAVIDEAEVTDDLRPAIDAARRGGHLQ
jgi:hypothetical protein